MKLLIDLGNTRLKCALWDGSTLSAHVAVAHAAIERVDFAALLKDIQKVDAVWIASVAALGLDRAVADAARARWGVEPVFVYSSAAACGVSSAYVQPERLG